MPDEATTGDGRDGEGTFGSHGKTIALVAARWQATTCPALRSPARDDQFDARSCGIPLLALSQRDRAVITLIAESRTILRQTGRLEQGSAALDR